MRTPIIIGNWKMNKTVAESIRTITELKGLLSGKQEAEIVIAPSFVSLHPAEIAAQDTPIKIAAQNVFYEENGAYTGEISASMLVDVGCRYVILGHSERRQIFQETDQIINKKIKSSLENELSPVLCIGETKTQRHEEKTFQVVEEQLKVGLRGVDDIEAGQVVIAYEPVWAIGTGDAASPGIAQEVHQFIREKLAIIFRKDISQKIRIIYGGSVVKENVKDLLSQPDIDGTLVGGASLDAKSFMEIIQYEE